MKKKVLSVMAAGILVMASLTGGSSASGLPKTIEVQVPAAAPT